MSDTVSGPDQLNAKTSHNSRTSAADKPFVVIFLFWLLLPLTGAHHFYRGKIGYGFVSLGLLAITGLLALPFVLKPLYPQSHSLSTLLFLSLFFFYPLAITCVTYWLADLVAIVHIHGRVEETQAPQKPKISAEARAYAEKVVGAAATSKSD